MSKRTRKFNVQAFKIKSWIFSFRIKIYKNINAWHKNKEEKNRLAKLYL